MIHIKPRYSIRYFELENERVPYTEWLESLDWTTQARIIARITRFENGQFGDHKSVGSGVFEARFFFGAGYRLYFAVIGVEIVLLLYGGHKGGQSRDIETAKDFLKIYLEKVNANKK